MSSPRSAAPLVSSGPGPLAPPTQRGSTSAALPLRYGCRILLYRQSLDGYVVATSSAEAPVGLQRDEPGPFLDARMQFEQAVFTVLPGEPVDASAGARGEGDVLKYGQVVRLVHQTRQQPLCHHVEQHAVGLKGNLRVLLGSAGAGEADRGAVGSPTSAKTRTTASLAASAGPAASRVDRWRVMPRYRLRVEGEAVADGDPVLLQSPSAGYYLCSAEQFDEVGDGRFLEVSCGSVGQGFQMLLYDPDVGASFRPSVLRCGDCITLLHTEEHMYVTADMERRLCMLRSPESTLAEVADEAELAPSLTTSLLCGSGSGHAREGSGRSSHAASAGAPRSAARVEDVNVLSAFFVEGVDPQYGGAMRAGGRQLYRLKCLSTGMYLRTGCSVANAQDVESDEPALLGHDSAALNDAKSVLSASSAVGGTGAGYAIPQSPLYELGLTANRMEQGTVFRVHVASSTSTDYVCSGSRVFLEAADTPSGPLWIVAGGRLDDEGTEAELTVASLTRRSTVQGRMALYARAVRSMRDGLELCRLPPRAARELHAIRGLLPPLERYAASMRVGFGNPSALREVRANLDHLQQLCYERTGATRGLRAEGLAGATASAAVRMGVAAGGAEDGLMDARNKVAGFVSPVWQRKLFQQGVPALVLRVAEATVNCPHVRPQMLHTADVARAPDGDTAADEVDAATAGSPTAAEPRRAGGFPAVPPTLRSPPNSPLSPSRRQARRFLPMRYRDLGDLLDTCFEFVALLVVDRPTYAESLQRYVDFIVSCCEHTPSALRCLSVMFQRNPVFVELPMAQRRLEYFLSLLIKRGRDPSVLRIVSLFAQCGEESMVEAQRVILEFLRKPEHADKLLCPLRLMPLSTELAADAVGAPTGGGDGGSAQASPAGTVTRSTLGNPLSPTSPRGAGESFGGGPAGRRARDAGRGSPAPLRRPRGAPTLPSRTPTGEVAMVGLPHSIFAEEQAGESVSVATSAQYRGTGSALGELLRTASNAEDVAGVTYFPVEGLNEVVQDWCEVKDVFLPYYAEQLSLFAALASGRNRRACEELVFPWAPPEALVLMVASEELPTAVHAACVALFACAMIDLGGSLRLRQELRNIRCVITGTSSDRPAVTAYGFCLEKPMKGMAEAKRYVARYLSTAAVSGDDEAAAEYVSTLQLTESLVNGGAFQLDEYTGLVAQLVNTLDPATDDRSSCVQAPTVHLCRLRALRLLHLIMDLMLTRKALEMVDCFRTGEEPPVGTQLFQYTFQPFRQRARMEAGRPLVEQLQESSLQPCPPQAHPATGASGTMDGGEGADVTTLELVGTFVESLMRLGFSTDSVRVRRHCILLYLRLTNYLEELYCTASRVQLLTSEASISFYADVNSTSAAMDLLLRKSFRRSNTHVLAHDALDALDRFLSVTGYGAAVEKLAMMRHVGIPLQLLAMLQRLPLPLRDSDRRIIFKVVSLLQTMSQDEATHDALRGQEELLAPLAGQDASILSLLRTLYLQRASERCVVPYGVIEAVARCLPKPLLTCAAMDFLVDLLSITDGTGHPITQHQQLVWRGIVSDPQVVRQVQLRYSWCGDKGRAIREAALTSRDYYVSTGRLSRHLSLTHLLYLISRENTLVKPEEVRHEVFGLNSLDAVLEVTTDARLPAFFRAPYVALTETLVLADMPALVALFAHRAFGEFLRMCVMDCARYLQLRGGTNAFPEVDEDVERRDDAALRCPAANAFERAIDDERFDVNVYERLVLGPLLGCLRRIWQHHEAGMGRLSNRARSQLKLGLNEVVDLLCDLVEHSFTDAPARAATAAVWTHDQDHRICDVLETAGREGFRGTGRWRGEPFDSLLERLVLRARVGGGAGGCGDGRMTEPLEKSAACGAIVVDGEADGGDGAPGLASPTRTGTEKALTSQWVAFLVRHVLESPYLDPEHVYRTAAGLILRSGDRGSSFLRIIFCTLGAMSGPNTVRLLRLTRQVAQLGPGHSLDDSALVPCRGVTTEAPCLTMEQSPSARQTLLARWPGDMTLENPIPLFALVSELLGLGFPGVRLAALETMNALLSGGHRGMQESYSAYCRQTAEERLFIVLRNDLSHFLDELRRFHQAMMRGSTPAEAEHMLPSMPDTTRELQLLQLLCANQFAPLQNYLVSQPDNNVSVNLVESLVELLSMSPKCSNEITTPFFLQLLRTMSESLQGPCRANQDSLVVYRAADYLTLLLSDPSVRMSAGSPVTAYEECAPRARRGERHRQGAAKSPAVVPVVAPAVTAASLASPAVDGTPQAKRAGRGGRGKARDGGKAGQLLGVEAVRRHCMARMHTAALSTLLALIEGRQEPEYIAKVLATVDLTVLGRSMDRSVRAHEEIHGSIARPHSRGVLQGDIRGSIAVARHRLRALFRGTRPSDRDELEDELALAVSIYTFFRACYDMQQLAMAKSLRGGDGPSRLPTHAAEPFVDKRGRSIPQVLRKTESYRRLGHRVAKVEISRDGALERVYFRILSSSEDNLRKGTRQQIIRHAVRTSDNERIQSFFSSSTSTIVEMQTLARMRGNIAVTLLSSSSALLRLLALVLILAMNLTMIIGLRTPTSPYDPWMAPGFDSAMRALGIAIMSVQGALLLQALSGPAWVRTATDWARWRTRQAEEVAAAARQDMAADVSDSLRAGDARRPTAGARRALLGLYSVVTTTEVVEHAFFLLVCVMGFVQHRIWYSVQLLQIMYDSPVLQTLITALSRNISSLVLTLVLTVFVIFVFTTISFFFFADVFDPLGSRGNGFNCYTLSQCLLVHVDNMRSGGGIGDMADWPTFYSADGRAYWFTFFRLAYYLAVVLILSNLFLGIIVDSLAQLRQSNEFILVDQQKKCFICGVERNVFDAVQPGTYDTHIAEEHHMWHYIYFLHYLSAKDPSTLTGQEAYVSRLARLRDLAFFPIGQSVVLSSLMRGGGGGGGGGSGALSGELSSLTGPGSSTAGASAGATAAASAETADSAVRRALDPLQKRLLETQETLERLVAMLEVSGRSPTAADSSLPLPQPSSTSSPGSGPPVVSFADPSGDWRSRGVH